LGQIVFSGSLYKILPLIRSEQYFADTHLYKAEIMGGAWRWGEVCPAKRDKPRPVDNRFCRNLFFQLDCQRHDFSDSKIRSDVILGFFGGRSFAVVFYFNSHSRLDIF